MSDFLLRTAQAFWSIMLDSGVWLLLGLALAGVVHAIVPGSFLTRHLARPDHQGPGRRAAIGPVLKASMLGIPMPLCSCSVIPVAASIRSAGASKGASAAFAISTPQTGEESVPLTWALFGPVYAFVRPIVAVITAFIAGTLIDRFTDDRPTGTPDSPIEAASCCRSGSPVPVAASCCGDGAPDPEPEQACCTNRTSQVPEPCRETGTAEASSEPPDGPIPRAIDALRYGFGVLLPDLAPWLATGLVASAFIAAAVPPGWIASHVGTGLVPMLLMLVVGLPLYVCATSTTPLAYTLVAAGLSPGAALVLLLAGPATNTATMAWVIKDLGPRALAIYLATIAAVAVAAGLVFDGLLSHTVRLADHAQAHSHGAVSALQTIGAAALVLLLVWALGLRLARQIKPRA